MARPHHRDGRRHARSPRGQALVELGFCITLLVFLTMGIIEFGRAWMIGNMITNAARDGARIGAVVGPTGRNGTGVINGANISSIQTTVQTEIKDVLNPLPAGLAVNVSQPTISGYNVVQVKVTATVPYLFKLPGVGTSFAVSRTATFRDEGR